MTTQPDAARLLEIADHFERQWHSGDAVQAIADLRAIASRLAPVEQIREALLDPEFVFQFAKAIERARYVTDVTIPEPPRESTAIGIIQSN